MNLATVDLGLLYLVSVVLEEKSATRAARRLHVTQSAVSNGLRRARELWGDPLLVRRPRGLEPTPRGLSLLPGLRAWTEETRRLLSESPAFDPRETRRVFRIACSDAVALTLLQPILRILGRRAPVAGLRLITLDRLVAEDGLARGDVDLLIGIPPVLPEGHSAELVYRDPMACIVRRDHPQVRRTLGLDVFARLPHVDLALFDAIDDTVDRALAKHGLSRRVRVALPHFSSVPLAVLETDAVATVSRRLARAFARQFPIRVLPPPVKLDPIEIRQVWHRRSDGDGAVAFLREVIADAGRRRG